MTTRILGDNAPRKSNFDPDLAKKLTKYYEEHPEELNVPNAQVSNTSGPLELIYGSYLAAIQAAVPETIQTSAELQKARVELNARKDNSLNGMGFYTANIPLYGVENGKSFLLFGGRKAFLRLYAPPVEEVYDQIKSQGYYILPPIDKAWALEEGIRSGALNRFDLAELIETRVFFECGNFGINSKKPAQLSGVKRELAELIYGQGKDYFECMQMFAENNISRPEVALLTPDYVNSNAGNNLIGRGSWLNASISVSVFVADFNNVSSHEALRGARKK